jgi:hypothetical protein
VNKVKVCVQTINHGTIALESFWMQYMNEQIVFKVMNPNPVDDIDYSLYRVQEGKLIKQAGPHDVLEMVSDEVKGVEVLDS